MSYESHLEEASEADQEHKAAAEEVKSAGEATEKKEIGYPSLKIFRLAIKMYMFIIRVVVQIVDMS